MPRTKNHLLTAGIWKLITAAAKTARKPSPLHILVKAQASYYRSVQIVGW
jgi:hypothetical protein